MKKLPILALVPFLALMQGTKFYGTGLGGSVGVASFDHQYSLLDGLYAYWSLDEANGTRFKTLGSAASADLLEVGGAVSSAAGYFNNGIVSAYGDVAKLETSSTPVSLAGGFTFAAWVNAHLESPGGGSQYLNVMTGGDPITNMIRLLRHRTIGATTAGWMVLYTYQGGVSTITPEQDSVLLPSRDTWHLVVGWYDPAAKTLSISVDDGLPAVSPASADLSSFTLNDVIVGGPAAWAAWDGWLDSPMIWTRVLSPVERHALFVRVTGGLS